MSDLAIRVENLSKAYRIGLKEQQHETLMGAMGAFLRSPFQNLRDLRKLTRFDDPEGQRPGTSTCPSPLAPRPNDNPSPLASQPATQDDVIWALRDVSFEVKHGEILGIIGRNGAGKSTLLKILARITEPTSGRAEINGRVGSLLEVGTGFHPDLTGRENIYLNGTILGMKKREVDATFDEIVEFSGVEKFIDTPVKRYSSGMRVRLAFSVAAHLEPEILIIDEVLAVGDADFQKKCLGKMSDVSHSGRTVLFVSHNLTAVRSLCSRAVLLELGAVRNEGEPDQVIKGYLGGVVEAQREVAWTDPKSAPGNGKIWLKRVSVSPVDGDEHEHVEITRPLQITVEYFNSIPGCVLNISLVLYTQDDICVLNTCSDAASHECGLHRAVCHIPGNFLNDETYRVRILLVQDSSRVLADRDQLVFFKLNDVARGEGWFGKWVGAVRPDLLWERVYLNDQ